MQIKNIKVYGLEESIIRSGYPHQIGEPDSYTSMGFHSIELKDLPKEIIDSTEEEIINYARSNNKLKFISSAETGVFFISEHQINRANKLANTPIGSGHNNYLKGIIVQFDMSYAQYFTPQLQRYHWIDIVSSQSKMHSLTKIKNIRDSCNKYVLDSSIDAINDLIMYYNQNIIGWANIHEQLISWSSQQELFQYIISNLPMGFELWMGISTNYLQLKTIYNQRKSHKLEDWREFCSWIKTLPMSELITGEIKDDGK